LEEGVGQCVPNVQAENNTKKNEYAALTAVAALSYLTMKTAETAEEAAAILLEETAIVI